ncbi:hypothetical protein CDAR_431321 [Caerostris darwini]|uniref:Uncharacterized protein n=1 Tax=Caerostris darwini TaxID=1538125 RepID=A0AAV4RR71_9ARAC|nr:hypothetical protein CDAR_431321 [Caerostris darwini]
MLRSEKMQGKDGEGGIERITITNTREGPDFKGGAQRSPRFGGLREKMRGLQEGFSLHEKFHTASNSLKTVRTTIKALNTLLSKAF